MRSEIIAEVRARAAQARRIADNMDNRGAQIELAEIADALEAHADALETNDAPNSVSQPATTHDGQTPSYLSKGIRKTQLKRDHKASLLASIQAGLTEPHHGMSKDEAIIILSQDLADYDEILARLQRDDGA
jgi:hypothetical protein